MKTQPGHDAERIFEAHGFADKRMLPCTLQSKAFLLYGLIKTTAGPVEELMIDGEMVNQSEKRCQI